MDRLGVLLETLVPALVIGGGFGYVLGRVERAIRTGESASSAGTSRRRAE